VAQRAVYSALLASVDSVGDSPTNLGGPPDGYLWVVRTFVYTIGSYLGYARAALSVGGEDPWLWLASTAVAKPFGFGQQSIVWEGRLVIPAGTELYGKSSESNTGDFFVSGYQLTVD